MFLKNFQRVISKACAFLRDQSGSIMIYTGAFLAIGVGGAALSIDIGRIVLLKTQMQNRADAGALAGAAQLDAQPGAIERSRAVVEDAMTAYTTAAADQGELAVWYTKFYAAADDKISMGAETDVDNVARFAQVVMERRTLSFFYAPAMNILTGDNASNFTYLDAQAIGMSDPFICKMQPLMVCNPYDEGDGTVSGALGDHPGYGLRIKQSPSTGPWQPGNFGLLDLPEDAGYSVGGANAVEAALSAEDPLGCYAVATLDTAPGQITMNVKNGVNTRWYGPNVAPNVMNYPHDNKMTPGHPDYVTGLDMGDGIWDVASYWAARHPGVALPTDLAAASRFQVYLFEQGQGFWKKSKKTSATVTVDPPDSNGGWKFIDPSAYPAAAVLPVDAADSDNNYVDGEPPVPPETVSSQGWKRRNIKIAVANCLSESFQGNDSIPADGVYVEMFLYTEATEPGSDGAEIYGEIVGAIEARTSLEFHGNVRLVF